MKPYPIMFASLVALASSVFAYANADEPEAEPRVDTTQYLVELTEYSLDKAVSIGLSEPELIVAIRDANAKPVETIRMTAMAEAESFVQLGRRITVTTGTVKNGNTASRQTTDVEIGTILRIRVKPNANEAIANIDYTTSRVEGDATDEQAPDILTNTTQSTQLYTLGKPRLLSMIDSGKRTAIIVTLREMQ